MIIVSVFGTVVVAIFVLIQYLSIQVLGIGIAWGQGLPAILAGEEKTQFTNTTACKDCHLLIVAYSRLPRPDCTSLSTVGYTLVKPDCQQKRESHDSLIHKMQ